LSEDISVVFLWAITETKTADALHVVTATEAGYDVLWTAGSDFAQRAGGIAIDGTRV